MANSAPWGGLWSAPAAVAMRGDPKALKSGRKDAAWLGLVPRHRRTVGWVQGRGLSKRGGRSLRPLLIYGVRSVLAHHKPPRGGRWAWPSDGPSMGP